MVPEPCCVHAAGLPGHRGPAMDGKAALGAVSAPREGESSGPGWQQEGGTAAHGCRAPGVCAGAVPSWDSAGTALAPEPGKHEERLRPMPGLGWARPLCSLPIFPDGSGCAVLNGQQIPILPSVRLCCH